MGVSILPGARSPLDLIGGMIGENLSKNLPGAVQQGYQRQLGTNALGQAEKDIASAGGDPFKIAMAFAKAGAQNPSLERVLGPLYQSAIQKTNANNIYGNGQQGNPSPQNPSAMQNQPSNQPTGVPPLIPGDGNADTTQARPTGYNIKTPDEMDAKAKRDAILSGNPAQYQQSLNEQQALNDIAQNYKTNLENTAINNGILNRELPDFMEVGEKFDTRNPNQWFKNTQAAYAPIKSSLDRLEKAFIPGVGSALLGKNREQALDRLTPDVQDLVKMGRGNQVRTFLAKNWLSPTEVEAQINPLKEKQKDSLEKFPKGFFPPEKPATYEDVGNIYKGRLPEKYTSPFVDYETAVKNAPKEMQHMQNQLAKFFKDNVDDKTSLLVLRDKLWNKHYDWRQVNSAIRQAQEEGLKLNPNQQAELTDIAQPPIQSLPHIFEDWWRHLQFLRGNK